MRAAALKTGGAGRAALHITRQLARAEYRVTVLDKLHSDNRRVEDPAAEFVEDDITYTGLLIASMRGAGVNTIVQFAGHIVVPESMRDPVEPAAGNSHIRELPGWCSGCDKLDIVRRATPKREPEPARQTERID